MSKFSRRVLDWRQMSMTTTYSRFALGVCMLSAGLLIGSADGAVAAADPEAGGSTASSESADGSTQSVSPATGQVESTADTGTSESRIDSTKVEPARPPGLMILNGSGALYRRSRFTFSGLLTADALNRCPSREPSVAGSLRNASFVSKLWRQACGLWNVP